MATTQQENAGSANGAKKEKLPGIRGAYQGDRIALVKFDDGNAGVIFMGGRLTKSKKAYIMAVEARDLSELGHICLQVAAQLEDPRAERLHEPGEARGV